MKVAQPKLGQYLKRHRLSCGLPLACADGVVKGLMHRIENGGDLQLSTLNRVLDAYGMKLEIVLK